MSKITDRGTGIRLIPKRPRANDQFRADDAEDFILWKTEIREVYGGAPIDVAEEFEACVALFTMIRKKARWTKDIEENLRTLFQLCVILTDRGYLAAQTLDVLSHARYTAYITTRIGYVSLPLKGDIHKICMGHALYRMNCLRGKYFRNNIQLDIRVKKLLECIYRQCSENSSVGAVVSYPDVNEIQDFDKLVQDDSVYPDRRESAIAAHTTICLPQQDPKPVMEYLEQLCREHEIVLSPAELTWFICEILHAYWAQDKVIRKSEQDKHYYKWIGKPDQEPLKQQAGDCFKLFALSSTAFMISLIGLAKDRRIARALKKSDDMPALGEEQMETFVKALQEHHEATQSARRMSKDEKELEAYFWDFVMQIKDDWALLCTAPYLIYLLWVSKEQNSYATRRSICLAKQINSACQPRTIRSNNVQANQVLFHFIVSLCRPQYDGSQRNWEKGQLYLFEQAEKVDEDGKTIGIVQAYEREVEKYRTSCLNIPLACIPSYPSQISEEALKALIIGHETEIANMRSTLIRIKENHQNEKKREKQNGDIQSDSPDIPDIPDIMTGTYHFFVNPDKRRYTEMINAEEKYMSEFSWNWLNIPSSAISPYFKLKALKVKPIMVLHLKNAILEWCALQNIREEKQKDLLSAFTFSSFVKI